MTALRMDRMPSGFGFSAAELEHQCRSRPHTPPFTPNRSKVRLQRADSPAPSIHPAETVSPAKKNAASTELPDTIVVQELLEGHPDYTTSMELVYPYELEEFDSEADTGDISDSDGDESDNGITGRMSQLQCEDKLGESQMARHRREMRESKRERQHRYKRTHSESVKSDSEATDPDAMGDHDLPGTARRLRRRTQGPEALQTPTRLSLRTSPPADHSHGSPRSGRLPVQLSAVESDDSDDMMEGSD